MVQRSHSTSRGIPLITLASGRVMIQRVILQRHPPFGPKSRFYWWSSPRSILFLIFNNFVFRHQLSLQWPSDNAVIVVGTTVVVIVVLVVKWSTHSISLSYKYKYKLWNAVLKCLVKTRLKGQYLTTRVGGSTRTTLFVSRLQSQGCVWTPDRFFSAHTERKASGPWGDIHWIWQKSLLD